MKELVKIRPFETSDLHRVLEIFRLNTPHFFAPVEEEELKKYLDTYSDTYFILEKDSVLSGAGGYHLASKTEGRLSWFFFDPELRGQGLGSRIVQYCLDELHKKHPRLLSIEVWTSQYAEGFFGKFGFQTIKIEKDHWADGIDLYLMRIEF